MAPLCRFYQQGNCRNGVNCRFEHPGVNTDLNPFGANRFGALANTAARAQDAGNTYKVTKESIEIDLADERPTWILSCYGPGKEAPEQLFGGYPREQSLEEVMLHIRRSANPQQALAEVTALHNKAEQQIQTTLGNLDGAVQFVLASANYHPNRIDICKQNTKEGGTTSVFAVKTGFADNPLTSNPGANQNPFSTTAQANPFAGGGSGGTPAFGQPSTLGQKPSPFGAAPSFGQPSQMGASTSPFGQPSQMGGAAPAFGQPSALGQRPNPFGAAPFTQTTQAAFGQPSALGQRPNPFSASPAAPAASNPFAQLATSKDLSMDTPGSDVVAPNPFGQPPSTNSGPITQAKNPFSIGAPAPSFDGQMTSFNGQPVVYKWKVNDRYQDQPPENATPDQKTPGIRKPDGTWRKILFPNGPPAYNKDTEPDAARYNATVKAAYAQMAKTGRFEGGMPEVPPMREDCNWSF